MNPHPQKKKTNKKLFEEDWSKFAEERIDKIKNQKDRENEIE